MKILQTFLKFLSIQSKKKNTKQRAREIISNERINNDKKLSTESANCEEW